ncbi:MAG: trypsin-like serine protease [Gammaproteobacteria bacterium]
MMSLQFLYPDFGFEHVCGASLVTPDWALTAAHCVADLPLDPASYRVVLGTNRLDDLAAAEIHTVQGIYFNNDWLFDDIRDVAVIRLATPSNRTPITLADAAFEQGIVENDLLRVIGWGVLMADAQDLAQTLNEIDLPVRTNEQVTEQIRGLCQRRDQ